MSDNNSLPLYTLYQSLVRDNYDVPDNYDSFERTLTAPGREGMESRRALYKSLAADNYDVPDTYESFANTLFAPKETGGYPTPASGAEDAEAVAPEEQKSWQPTLQQRLATAQALNGGMASFRAAAAAGRERTQRAMERNTPQGRRQAQAAEMQAQMAGLPTQALGIGAAAPQGAIGSDAPSTQPRGVTGKAAEVSRRAMERAADREVRSLSGPVVRGMVPGPDGKPVTQWELPDGTLTTDFAEADRAAASSRRNRLAHEFTRRMEENGLDPAKETDVKRQMIAERLQQNETKLKELYAERDAEENKARHTGSSWDVFVQNVGSNANRSVTANAPKPEITLTPRDKAIRDLLAENDMLEEAKRKLDAGKDLSKSDGWLNGLFNLNNNVKNIWRGVTDKFKEPDLYAQGVMSLHKNDRLDIINEKIKSGQPLTDSEYRVAYAAMLDQSVSGLVDLPHGYTAGQTTTEMVPFMIQMALNPASGFGRGLVARFGKKGLRKIALTVGGDLTEAAVLANTLQAPKTIADIRERHRGDVVQDGDNFKFEGGEKWLTAIRKGEGAAVIENYTELLGAHFGKIAGAAGRGVEKGARALGGGKVLETVSKFTDRIKASDWGKAITNIEKRAQWNGTFGEVLEEEEAGIVLNSIFVGDNRLSDLIDAEQQIDIVLGVGLFGNMVSGIKTAGYPIGRVKADHNLRKADNAASSLFSETQWGIIRDRIINADETDIPSTVLTVANEYSSNQEQDKVILGYAAALIKARGYNIADLSKRQEQGGRGYDITEEINDCFEQGYEVGQEVFDDDEHIIINGYRSDAVGWKTQARMTPAARLI